MIRHPALLSLVALLVAAARADEPPVLRLATLGVPALETPTAGRRTLPDDNG